MDKLNEKSTNTVENSEQKPASRKRMLRRVLLIALALSCVAGIVYAGVTVYRVLNPKTLFEVEAKGPAAPTPKPEIATPSPHPATDVPVFAESTREPEPTHDWSAFENTSRLNLLILGLDGSPERGGDGYNSDTMLLVSLDLDEDKISMVSILRDSYVPIYPKGRYGKINSAFGAGGGVKKDGFKYAVETVQSLFGVKIHHYVGFNMPLVTDVVEAMGGVDYDVDLRVKLQGRVIEKGPQHLNGQQVLDYCRFRSTPQADIGRVARQQLMLKAIFKQLLNTGQIKNLPAIYESVSKNIYTDLSLTQITSLCVFLSQLSSEDFETHTVPGAGVGSVQGYYGIDNAEFEELVETLFGIEFTPNPDTDIEAVRKRIRNASTSAKPSKPAETPAPTAPPTPAVTAVPTEVPFFTETPASIETPIPTEALEPEETAVPESTLNEEDETVE